MKEAQSVTNPSKNEKKQTRNTRATSEASRCSGVVKRNDQQQQQLIQFHVPARSAMCSPA